MGYKDKANESNNGLYLREVQVLYVSNPTIDEDTFDGFEQVEQIVFCRDLFYHIHTKAFSKMSKLKKMTYPGYLELFEEQELKGDRHPTNIYGFHFAHNNPIIMKTKDDTFDINANFVQIEIEDN